MGSHHLLILLKKLFCRDPPDDTKTPLSHDSKKKHEAEAPVILQIVDAAAVCWVVSNQSFHIKKRLSISAEAPL